MAAHQQTSETQKFSDAPTGRGRKIMTHIGDNIDLVNFFGRQKDYYKLFEFAAPFMASTFIWLGTRMSTNHKVKNLGSQLSETVSSLLKTDFKASNGDATARLQELEGFATKIQDALKLKDQQNAQQSKANFLASTVADTLNGITLAGIAMISSWIEKRETEQIYGSYVKAEQGLARGSTFKDLRKSNNPIIKDVSDYYARKSRYRLLPNLLSFGKLIPAVVRLFDKKGYDDPQQKKYQWAKPLEKWDGIKASGAGWAGYFSWYFIARQTGSHYELKRIWNKTEGFSHLPNRAINQGTSPGEEVTNKDINTLYGKLVQESKQKKSGLPTLTDKGPDDPLTDRLFTQIADYLNYNYIHKLLDSRQRIARDDPDYRDTHFSFRDLLHLMGTGGIDVNNAMKTAIRIETLAHHNRETYDILSARLDTIARPEGKNFSTVRDATHAMHRYLDTIETEARSTLGEHWPPHYLQAIGFREEVVDAFLEREMGVEPNGQRTQGQQQRLPREQNHRTRHPDEYVHHRPRDHRRNTTFITGLTPPKPNHTSRQQRELTAPTHDTLALGAT